MQEGSKCPKTGIEPYFSKKKIHFFLLLGRKRVRDSVFGWFFLTNKNTTKTPCIFRGFTRVACKTVGGIDSVGCRFVFDEGVLSPLLSHFQVDLLRFCVYKTR